MQTASTRGQCFFVCQNTTTTMAEYTTPAAVWPDGNDEPTGDVSSRGTFGRGRPTIQVVVMKTDASRSSAATTKTGSFHRRQTSNITSAISAVTAILATVSESCEPTNVRLLRVWVRCCENQTSTWWSVRCSHECRNGWVIDMPIAIQIAESTA